MHFWSVLKIIINLNSRIKIVLILTSACTGGFDADNIGRGETKRDARQRDFIMVPRLIDQKDLQVREKTTSCDIVISNLTGPVISPGKVCIGPWVFYAEKEGLYRLFDFDTRTAVQFIVFKEDILGLLSGFSWMIKHGNLDDNNYSLNYNNLKTKLLRENLSLTCGPTSFIVSRLLAEQGIESRMVSFIRNEDFNNFDNGHILLEVKIEGDCFGG